MLLSAPAGVGRGTRRFKASPHWLHGGELHPYQLEGLNWLFHSEWDAIGDWAQ